jgi:branched-chain amino acid transport system permease protein
VLINKFDLIAAALAAVLVAGSRCSSRRPRIGRALRAVADDHQAAQSVGIPLSRSG